MGDTGSLERMLIILPNASPSINKIFDTVAGIQNAGFLIPIIQNIETARYTPIIALKMFARSVFSKLKWSISLKIPSGIKPYTIAAGVIMQTDIIK